MRSRLWARSGNEAAPTPGPGLEWLRWCNPPRVRRCVSGPRVLGVRAVRQLLVEAWLDRREAM